MAAHARGDGRRAVATAVPIFSATACGNRSLLELRERNVRTKIRKLSNGSTRGDRELFEAVQRRLTEQRTHHVTTRTKNEAPLKGILFDAAGDPMVATHATKQGVRYRYYVSQPYLRGLATPPIGARLFVFLLRTLKRSLARRSGNR